MHKYAEIFCWKNVSRFCSAKATHIFLAKNIRIFYIETAETAIEMNLNELVKLTTLWTTGPWSLKQSKYELAHKKGILWILSLWLFKCTWAVPYLGYRHVFCLKLPQCLVHVREHKRLWQDCVIAQAHLSLCWSPMCYDRALLPSIICLGRLRIACKYIFNLWQLRQGVDSLAQWLEHWIFNQEDRVRIPRSAGNFFSYASFLCYDFHVVRWRLVWDWTLYAENGLTSSKMMTSLKRGSVTTEHSYLRLSALADYA